MDTISNNALLEGYKHFFEALAYIDVQTQRTQILFFYKFGALNPFKNGEYDYNDISHKMLDLIAPEFHERYMEFKDLSTLPQRLSAAGKIWFDYKLNDFGWIRTSIVPIDYDENGELHHILMTGNSIAYEKKLQHRAETDTLTGLLNHKTAKEQIEEAMESSREGILIILDCDHLKAINDNCGHYIGSQCILGIGRQIATVFPNAISFRYGGDEFGIYLHLKEDIVHVHDLIQDFFVGMEHFNASALELQEAHLKVNISIGAAHYDGDPSICYKELFLKADACMYQSKKQAGNSITFG